MHRWHFGILALVCTATSALAQEPPADLQPLWNGRDLSGWAFLNCTKADWLVESAILSTRTGKIRNGAWILTELQYDDFELHLEYLLTKGADSGVALRTASTGAPHVNGIEIQLVDDAANPRLKPQETTGALWGIVAPTKKAGKPAGEWNHLHITVIERKLKVVINDITVQDVELNQLKGPEGLQRDAGYIGLQTRIGVVKFRNVLIKPLGEAPPPGKIALTLDAGGHTAKIGTVFFTKDGKQLVTGSADHTVRVWDVATGTPRQVLRPPGMATVMALSPTEDKVAVASKYYEGKIIHHVIYLMRLEDGRIEGICKGHKDRILQLAFARDGKHLASSAADGTVRVWDPATGKVEGVIVHKRDPEAGFIALSPAGDRVACLVRGGDTLIIEVATGKSLAKLPKPTGTHRYYGVDWSPDGKTIVTSTWGDRSKDGSLGRGFFLWNPDGTPHPRQPEGPFRTNGVTFSNDGRRLLLPWDTNPYHRATLVDLDTGKPGATFEPTKPLVPGYNPPRGAWGGALSPDGTLAVTLGGGQGLHEAFLWRTADGKLVHRLAARGWNQGQAAWSPDGKSVAWGKLKANTRPLFDFGELRLGKSMSPAELQGPLLKQGELTLERQEPNKRYWEMQVVKDSKVVARLGVPHVPSAVSFVGLDRVAMASDYGRFFLHDIASQKPMREFKLAEGKIPKTSTITSVAASPTKTRLLATTGIDQMLRIWSPERDRPLLNLYVQGEDWIIWTEEGYYAATPGGERLIGWTVDNGIDKAADFYPAEQFQKQLYRPDIIQRVLEKGDVAEAVKAANAARKSSNREIPKGIANPEKLLPPDVRLAIVDESKKPMISVRIEAAQACPEQPIKSLRLFMDGRPLPGGQGHVPFPEGQEKARFKDTWTVELPAGKHKLFVLARSKDDTPSSSNIVEVETPLPTEQRPVLHHLAVGVSQYDQPKLQLKYAHSDARSLLDAFTKTSATNRRYEKVHGQALLNERATRQAVLDAITAIRKVVKSNDLFVLSFAGHGLCEEGEFFLLPKEADPTSAKTLDKTAISGTVLRQRLADFPCQVLLMLDACHSGSLGGGLKPGSDEASRALADVDARVAVLCAALGHEEASEKPGKGGLFTNAVVRALGQDPDAFYDRQTGELNVSHLHAFVYQVVAKDSDYKQSPYLKLPLAHPPFVVTQFPPAAPGLQK